MMMISFRSIRVAGNLGRDPSGALPSFSGSKGDAKGSRQNKEMLGKAKECQSSIQK
ncbi:hypothetical protein [Prochlorococcus marinus]|uniref:hypothetical protein n=1 Tax=Prochlorococcus marinus TaxID=1219 RepID=UPI0012DAA042|nr:hypothetical protein [Prochlorococcus marinus]